MRHRTVVAGTGQIDVGDEAAVTVGGCRPLAAQLDGAAGDNRFQCRRGLGRGGDFQPREPHLTAVVQHKAAAVLDGGDRAGAGEGEAAGRSDVGALCGAAGVGRMYDDRERNKDQAPAPPKARGVPKQ